MFITDLETWLYAAPSREHSNNYSDVKLDGPKTIVAYLFSQNQRRIRPITVAGTKGKGSTLRLIEAGMLALGKSCLSFTSPHVNAINERWRFQGQPLDDTTLLLAAEAINQAEATCQCKLTYFERCFTMAVYLTAELDADYLLCEVGLGGRLDCANVLDAQCAVVTSLSYDHCSILGNTLAEISAEKLAIARTDAPLIIAPQSDEAAAAIATHSLRAAIVIQVKRELTFSLLLQGDHQQDNANTAWTCINHLLPLADAEILRHAFEQVQLAARCQIIKHGSRTFMVDAAHNGASMRACIACAHDVLKPDFTIIIGCSKDKMLDDICTALPLGQTVLRCSFDWPRSCGPDNWPQKALAWPYFPSVKDALAVADPEQDCCITGSFYLAGEAIAALGVNNQLPG